MNNLSNEVKSRRNFLERIVTAGVCGGVLTSSTKINANEPVKIEELPPGVEPSNPRELIYPTPPPSTKLFTQESGSYVASYPMIQNISENSATIVWALNVPSTGWVEWGTTPALGKVARNSEFGLNPYESNFLSTRLSDLSPNTTYYYRTVTCAFNYKAAYDKSIADPQYSDVYSFKTVGANVETASFAVMNDTHNQVDVIRKLCERFDELDPDLIFWNGDLCHRYFFPLIAKTAIANPCDMPFVAERPLVYVPGNHEKRGPYAHSLKECLTPRRQDNPRFYSLGYNAAFRLGPMAIVTLDTGDTPADDAPQNQGIMSFDPYRDEQAAWLENVLSLPEIASAPYLITFCHVPLCKPNPTKDDRPTKPLKWVALEASSAKRWGPILDKSNVTLMISAHLHKFAYSEASPERPWAQLLGGGPLLASATCIHAEATSEQLTVTCEKVEDRSVLGSWTFKPRQ